jgi:hypothetical protein
MRIVINKIIPFGKNFYAINLFGVLFVKGPCSPMLINHEKIHTAQMKDLLYLFFYLAYVVEWLVRLLQFRNGYEAYRNISFEREAYANQKNLKYLNGRKRYSFLNYLTNAK